MKTTTDREAQLRNTIVPNWLDRFRSSIQKLPHTEEFTSENVQTQHVAFTFSYAGNNTCCEYDLNQNQLTFTVSKDSSTSLSSALAYALPHRKVEKRGVGLVIRNFEIADVYDFHEGLHDYEAVGKDWRHAFTRSGNSAINAHLKGDAKYAFLSKKYDTSADDPTLDSVVDTTQ